MSAEGGRLRGDVGREGLDTVDVIGNAIAIQLALRIRHELGFVQIGRSRSGLE